MKLAINIEKITKTYPGVLANSDVSIDVRSGDIHAIVGENGAGKSTLMKILYGMVKPDEGSIEIFQSTATMSSPKDAINLGIGMVHQHFMLAKNLTVLENIILGIDKPFLKNIRLSKYRSEIKKVMDTYSLNIDLNQYVEELSVGEKQRVEIIKVLYRGAKILILDEPTAVLVPQEVKELFENLKDLKTNGVTVLFISHKLDEVLEIADRISVMRSGQMIDTVINKNVSKVQLAEMMIGKSLPTPPPRITSSEKEEVLSVHEIASTDESGRSIFENITFSVHKSEILGIAGVEGNGQKEVVESIIGIQSLNSGEIIFQGNDIKNQGTRERLESGISFIPEDRQLQAMIMDMNLTNNVIIGRQNIEKYKSSLGTVKMKNAVQESEKVIESFEVKTPSTSTLATALSGGNQQKFVVGRELEDNPSLLIASQPTRGIDIGAQALIWEKLRNSRDEGLSVLLISADLEELIGLSDRIIVFYQGKLVKELNAEKVSPEDLGGYMTGLKK
jgi:simple sugar transport system ATP-binding protein|tara:strand:- start:2349 stop:3860 length:1512 start_codon:yes stop_codon:yes gene_type:complete